MGNERITENLTREQFNSLGYYADGDLSIEEQISQQANVNKLLKNASKKNSGKGYPEFIITSKQYHDFICVVECKADVARH